jgi:hypothetical protein
MLPLTTFTSWLAALCTYCTTWSNAAPQYVAAYGRACTLSQCQQSLLAASRDVYTSSVP